LIEDTVYQYLVLNPEAKAEAIPLHLQPRFQALFRANPNPNWFQALFREEHGTVGLGSSGRQRRLVETAPPPIYSAEAAGMAMLAQANLPAPPTSTPQGTTWTKAGSSGTTPLAIGQGLGIGGLKRGSPDAAEVLHPGGSPPGAPAKKKRRGGQFRVGDQIEVEFEGKMHRARITSFQLSGEANIQYHDGAVEKMVPLIRIAALPAAHGAAAAP